MMRIIAGTARGRRIFSVPKTMPVKPISSRIRQSVFDMLRPRIPAAIFLDLFSGTGAVGLEALSRGAMKVVFVEREPVCLKNINRNLDHLGFKDKAQILKADILKGTAWLSAFSQGEGYDIIYIAPPYRDQKNRPLAYTGPVLRSVAEGGLCAPTGIIAAQHHIKEEYDIPKNITLIRRLKYGDTIVSVFKPLPQNDKNAV